MEKEAMKNIQLVVLMAGNATRLAPLTYALPKGLLSIKDKPGIYNMLYDFVRMGLKDMTFIVSPSNQGIVKNFITKAFNGINVNFVVQQNPKGPLHAFSFALPYITKPTLLLLGDTSCETDLNFENNWLGYMEIKDDSHSRWCLIETDKNNKVIRQIDKPQTKPNTNKALVGIYFFKNPVLLKEALTQEYETIHKEYQLSSAIDYYNQIEKFESYEIKHWQDSGALNTYTDTIKDLKSDKYDLIVDNYNCVTKSPKEAFKKDFEIEREWYRQNKSGAALSLFPAVYALSEDNIKLEYLDYTTLAEYFNFYPMPQNSMLYMFDKTIAALDFMHKQPLNLGFNRTKLSKQLKEFLITGPKAVLNFLKENNNNKAFKKLLGHFQNIFTENEKRLEEITSQPQIGITHNNLCFSNIFYLPKISGIKFISPKGFASSYIADIRLDFACLYSDYAFNLYQTSENLFSNEQAKLNWLCEKMPVDGLNNILKNYTEVENIKLIALALLIHKLPLLTIRQQTALLTAASEQF